MIKLPPLFGSPESPLPLVGAGVYVLLEKEKVCYVGQTSSFKQRKRAWSRKRPSAVFVPIHRTYGPTWSRIILEAAYQLKLLGTVKINHYDAISLWKSLKTGEGLA